MKGAARAAALAAVVAVMACEPVAPGTATPAPTVPEPAPQPEPRPETPPLTAPRTPDTPRPPRPPTIPPRPPVVPPAGDDPGEPPPTIPEIPELPPVPDYSRPKKAKITATLTRNGAHTYPDATLRDWVARQAYTVTYDAKPVVYGIDSWKFVPSSKAIGGASCRIFGAFVVSSAYPSAASAEVLCKPASGSFIGANPPSADDYQAFFESLEASKTFELRVCELFDFSSECYE